MIERIIDFIIRNFKRIVFIFTLVVVLGVGYFFISSYGFVEISVENTQPGNWDVELINQADRTSSKEETGKTSIKKLVRKNNYEALVSQGTANGYASFTTPGFFRTTSVTIPLQKEKLRQFIGDNPGTCMHYIDQSLFSYGCRSSTNDQVVKHIPATKTLATYAQQIGGISLGTVYGFNSTKTGNIAFLEPSSDLEGGSFYAYKVSKRFTLNEGEAIVNGPGISTSTTFHEFEDGTMILDKQSVWSYKHLGSTTKLTIDEPNNKELLFASNNVNNNALVRTYNNLGDGFANDALEEKPKQTEFIVYSGGQNKHVEVGKGYYFGGICGENLLCAWDDIVDVYDISSDKPKYVRSLVGASGNIEVSGDFVSVLNDKGLLKVDPKTGVGFYEYTLGEFTSCGIEYQKNVTLLCVIDGDHTKRALLISKEAVAVDEIDKQVFALSKIPEIKDLNIYKQFVYITPKIGDLRRQPDGTFNYDPTLKKVVLEKLQREIGSSGIDVNKYTVKVFGL